MIVPAGIIECRTTLAYNEREHLCESIFTINEKEDVP